MNITTRFTKNIKEIVSSPSLSRHKSFKEISFKTNSNDDSFDSNIKKNIKKAIQEMGDGSFRNVNSNFRNHPLRKSSKKSKPICLTPRKENSRVILKSITNNIRREKERDCNISIKLASNSITPKANYNTNISSVDVSDYNDSIPKLDSQNDPYIQIKDRKISLKEYNFTEMTLNKYKNQFEINLNSRNSYNNTLNPGFSNPVSSFNFYQGKISRNLVANNTPHNIIPRPRMSLFRPQKKTKTPKHTDLPVRNSEPMNFTDLAKFYINPQERKFDFNPNQNCNIYSRNVIPELDDATPKPNPAMYYSEYNNNEVQFQSLQSSEDDSDADTNTIVNDLNKFLKKMSDNNSNKNEEEIEKNKAVTLDDFEQIEIISQGGFGRVYLAKKKTTNDYYAIKKIYLKYLEKKNLFNLLINETSILNNINNDFVVKCYYSFSDKDFICFVMEFLNGGDLSNLLRFFSTLSEEWVKWYAAEIILALDYLHSKQIIHRDLKPENIMIDQTVKYQLI